MVNEGKKDSEISMSFRIKNQNTYVTIYKEFQNIGYNFILEGRLFHRSTLECTKAQTTASGQNCLLATLLYAA